ncbi:MAG: glycosyltransferase family 4 protein, partial [Ferruginibacter sp.]
MRLAFISHEYPPDTGKGGIGTYVNQIATAMAASLHDIHVFSGSNTRSNDENENGFWVHRIQCVNGQDFRDKVVGVFEQYHSIIPFDIIESAEINGDALELKRTYPGLLLVVRLHAPNRLIENLKKRYVPTTAKLRFVLGALKRFRFDLGYWRSYKKETDPDYKFIQLADGITAPSEAMKSWAVKNWHLPPANISVLPNIFSPSPALLKMPVNKSTEFKRVVFFGRLNVLKGLVNASRAMKKILIEFPDWKFRVIGDDGNGPSVGVSMRTWMQQELSTVIEQVEFKEGLPYEEIPGNIEDAEIVLLPSLFESFSYTCIE